MPRSSAVSRPPLFVALICVVISIGILSGCAPAPLTFGQGATVRKGMTVEWKDGFADDAQWEIVPSKEDDDDASEMWTYEQRDGACMATFIQTASADVVPSTDDDRDGSDQLLAMLRGFPDAAEGAITSRFRNDDGAGGSIEMRTIHGEEHDATFVIAARAFARGPSGVMVMVFCDDGIDADDADDAFDEVLRQNPVIIAEN